MIKLSLQEQKFCLEFLKLNNAAMAYRIAFDEKKLSLKTLDIYGRKLLEESYIKKFIEKERKKLLNRTRLEIQDVVAEWLNIAYADPTEILQIRRINCRYCFGNNFNYRYIDNAEFFKKNKNAIEDENLGGVGYNFYQEPNIDCPKCGGDGIEIPFIADTRTLTAGAKSLYNGFEKIGKNTRVLLRDRDAALVNLVKYLGAFQKDKPGNTVVINNDNSKKINPPDLSGVTDQIKSFEIYKDYILGVS